MLKTTALAAVLATLPLTVSAQSLIRERIDNTMNNIQSMLGDDSADHEVRRLSDRIQLLDTEQQKMLALIEAKRVEREEAAAALAALGVTPPPPVIMTPVTLPGAEGQPERMCITTPGGTPLHCW